MDWMLLVLIMAFIFWSFQMIVVYRRQIERYDEQIRQVRANAEEISEQIVKNESDHAEKRSELESLRLEAEGLDKTEKELDEEIKTLKSTDDGRLPGRFRLDPNESAGD
jgi:chromosome segregation ATPase